MSAVVWVFEFGIGDSTKPPTLNSRIANYCTHSPLTWSCL